jgi:cupin 2 domain-containing protein
MPNICKLSQEVYQLEKFEQIASGKNIQIERIISRGHSLTSGQWYDQTTDEWLISLKGEAELSYDDDTRVKLKSRRLSAHSRV